MSLKSILILNESYNILMKSLWIQFQLKNEWKELKQLLVFFFYLKAVMQQNYVRCVDVRYIKNLMIREVLHSNDYTHKLRHTKNKLSIC